MTNARISTLLGALTLMAALWASASSSPRPATLPAFASGVAARRARHRPAIDGCFVPPPEPVAAPPCDDRRSAR